MSVVFTGTNQGRFTSNGSAKILQIRSDLDWMWVYNQTQLLDANAGADQGVQFYWQRGMVQGGGIQFTKATTTNALTPADMAANGGFYLVDSSVNIPGPALTSTQISNATPPVVSTTATTSLNNYDVVRLALTPGVAQFAGYDATINNISPGSSFAMPFMPTIASTVTANGKFRRIPFNPLFYPPVRLITNITQAQQAIVTLSVRHNFTIGQKIRFVVPTIDATSFGMTELDGVEATIVDISDPNTLTLNTITVDVDTTGFTAFAFPTNAEALAGFTPAQVIPVGENTAEALNQGQNILADATVNTGFIGIQLQAGANSPAGSADDVIYWVAGKSFSIDNE